MLAIASPRANRLITAGWLAFATVNAALMYVAPGQETIPYHLIWASFALIYGLVSWPAWATQTAFWGITVVTGAAIVRYGIAGIIGWEESSEIVLMGVIVAFLIWHVNRYRAAVQRVDELREAERVRAGNRELATRFGSHELRTRLTIARGMTELIHDTTSDQEVRSDAAMAIGELDKASSLATNLMTLVRVDSSLPLEPVDLDELVHLTVRRWAARANRDWVAMPIAGFILANAERVQAAVDCLVENAVKFTDDGGRISIDAYFDGPDVVITVADSGTGIPAEEVALVTDLFHTSSRAGHRAGSGLGLPIVRAAVESRGGSLTIASELGVGTQATIRMPHGNDDFPPRLLMDRATAQTVHPWHRPNTPLASQPAGN